MASSTHETKAPPAGEAALGDGKGRSLWGDAVARLRRDRGAMLCLGIIVVYGLVAIGAYAYDAVAASRDDDAIVPFSEMTDYANKDRPPVVFIQSPDGAWRLNRWQNWLGTDWAGKGVLVKTLLGVKVSLTVALLANVLAVPLGMLLGAIAGYFGRALDDLIVWVYTTMSAVPGIILLIAIKFAFKGKTFLGLDLGGMPGLILAMGVTNWIGTCRLVRAETMKLRELDYVLAARACGRGGFSILLRHIVPNVAHIGIINFSLGFVGAIMFEVTLSYLGLGVAVGTPSWGTMIDAARMDLIAGRWWELTAAVTAVFLLVLALNTFGDRLRDALDPKLRTA